MNTYSYPKSVPHSLPKWLCRTRASQLSNRLDLMMFKTVAWAITLLTLAFLVWQTTAFEPLWPRYVSGLLLATVGLLAGLRIAAESSAKYIKDLQRLNKVLAEQNRDLQDVNAFLLKDSDGGPTIRSKSG